MKNNENNEKKTKKNLKVLIRGRTDHFSNILLLLP